MPFEIELSATAGRAYAKANHHLRDKIDRCLEHLADDPFQHPNIKRLKGRFDGSWRFRIGDYRVVYLVDVERERVIVITIAHRSNVYE